MSDSILENIPENIRSIIAGKPYTVDSTGLSGSGVFLFEDMVLKIEPLSGKTIGTVEVMCFLEDKLPVPKVICHGICEDRSYLLMSRVPGEMACSEYYLEHNDELVELLAEAIKQLWTVDISCCPRERGLEQELAEARYRVEHGLADMEGCQPETYGEGGFSGPEELLEWLENNRPDCDPVMSHGDLCLPNIFLKDGKVSGFIDLGDSGIGDRWRDLALCYRSLKNNLDGTYGGRVFPNFDPDSLFRALGIEPDREKLRYYILLDELF